MPEVSGLLYYTVLIKERKIRTNNVICRYGPATKLSTLSVICDEEGFSIQSKRLNKTMTEERILQPRP